VKISDAQWGVLWQLAEHGPLSAVEVMIPPKMDGSRRVKIECHALNAATLDTLRRNGLVHVARGATARPQNAVGKAGHARTRLTITLTDQGREVLARAKDGAPRTEGES